MGELDVNVASTVPDLAVANVIGVNEFTVKDKARVTTNFLSWIPCVIGRLGFDRLDVGLGKVELIPKNKIVRREDGKTHGYVRLASKHDWTDVQLANADGTFFTLLVGDYEIGGDVLNGSILFVPVDMEVHWKAIKSLAENQFEDGLIGKHCIEGAVIVAKKMKEIATDPLVGAWVANYRLDFTGIFSCSIFGKTDAEEQLTAAQWSYYYAKYAFHKHQHHLHGVDSLVTAYPDDANAGKCLLSDLKLAVSDIKRHSEAKPGVRLSKRESKDLQRAAGIAAYCKSLVEALRLSGRMDEPTAKSESLFIDNAIKSMEKRTDEIRFDYESGADTRTLIAWIAAGFGPAAYLLWKNLDPQSFGITFNSLRDLVAFFWAFGVITAFALTYLSSASSQVKTRYHLLTFSAGLFGFIFILFTFS